MLQNHEPDSLHKVCESHNACPVPQYGGSFTHSPDLYSNGAIAIQFKGDFDRELDWVLILYNKCRFTVTASRCDIETNTCTYAEVCYTHHTPSLFGHTCGVAILRELHYQG